MSYNENLAERVRHSFGGKTKVAEKKMFGGIAFMVRDHMCCGVIQDDLVVRVGPERNDEALAQTGARPMDFTGRPMAGYVYVSADGYAAAASLRKWVHWGIQYVSTLPPKAKKRRS